MNAEKPPFSPDPDREPKPLEEVLGEFADQYPDAIEEMAAQQRQRDQVVTQKELDNAAKELLDIKERQAAGEDTPADAERREELRHEIWQKQQQLFGQEDQITNDDQ